MVRGILTTSSCTENVVTLVHLDYASVVYTKTAKYQRVYCTAVLVSGMLATLAQQCCDTISFSNASLYYTKIAEYELRLLYRCLGRILATFSSRVGIGISLVTLVSITIQ